jgi:plasmid stability protein
MTYTLSNIPDEIERALRERAAAEHKSLDATIVDALARGLGLSPQKNGKKRDLSFLTKGPPLEPEVIRALEDQRRIDAELWQ